MIPAGPDPALGAFIHISEVDDGRAFAEHIFQRKYRQSAPDFPRHYVAFYRHREDHLVPVSYLHFTQHTPEILLVGGACTDGRVFGLMSEQQRALVTAAGGLFGQVHRYAFSTFPPGCEAIGGHCGDARSWSVLASLGYQRTAHPYVIAHWLKPLGDDRKQAILRELESIGPF